MEIYDPTEEPEFEELAEEPPARVGQVGLEDLSPAAALLIIAYAGSHDLADAMTQSGYSDPDTAAMIIESEAGKALLRDEYAKRITRLRADGDLLILRALNSRRRVSGPSGTLIA